MDRNSSARNSKTFSKHAIFTITEPRFTTIGRMASSKFSIDTEFSIETRNSIFHSLRHQMGRWVTEPAIPVQSYSPTDPERLSPAEFFLGRKIRMNFQVNTSSPKRHVNRKNYRGKEETRNESPTIRKGRYKVGDWVLTKLPHAPKGKSPFSEPKQVTEVLGYWSDQQKLNAQKPKPFRRKDAEDPWMMQTHEKSPLRRSARQKAGKAPARYSP